MSLTKVTYSMINGAWLNVLDFGAKGDGSNDDTSAIQAAIDYAKDNNLSGVYLPAGTYNTSTPLMLYTGISFIGENQHTTFINKTVDTVGTGTSAYNSITDSYAQDANLMVAHDPNVATYWVQIKNITFTRPDYVSGSAAIIAFRVAEFLMENVGMVNTQVGFRSYTIYMSVLRQAYCQAVDRGFDFPDDGSHVGAGTSLTLENCWVNFDNTAVNPYQGYYFYGMTYSTLISCGCDNGIRTDNSVPNGYVFSACRSMTLNACGIENHKGQVINAASSELNIVGFRGAALLSNPSWGGTVATIYVDNGSKLNFVGGEFEATTPSGTNFYNWVIQGGSKVSCINLRSEPSGGDTFISYTTNGSKAVLTDGKWIYENNPGTAVLLYGYLNSAAPVGGTWAVGDIFYNNAPTSGGYIGWVCTVAGTPGTWKGFGLIA